MTFNEMMARQFEVGIFIGLRHFVDDNDGYRRDDDCMIGRAEDIKSKAYREQTFWYVMDE